ITCFISSWRYDYTTIHRDNLWHLSRFPDVELLRGFSPHFNSYFHYQNIISCSNILGFFGRVSH
ncbi:hypothetical protein, partial [Plasmodium yoelii yoelii]